MTDGQLEPSGRAMSAVADVVLRQGGPINTMRLIRESGIDEWQWKARDLTAVSDRFWPVSDLHV